MVWKHHTVAIRLLRQILVRKEDALDFHYVSRLDLVSSSWLYCPLVYVYVLYYNFHKVFNRVCFFVFLFFFKPASRASSSKVTSRVAGNIPGFCSAA